MMDPVFSGSLLDEEQREVDAEADEDGHEVGADQGSDQDHNVAEASLHNGDLRVA